MSGKPRCIVRLRLQNDERENDSSFGPGTALLLQGIVELKSLNKAAKRIGMAYSKAWTCIRATETHLGISLIERHAQRGSVLTADGERLLDFFLRAQAAAEQAASEVFRDY